MHRDNWVMSDDRWPLIDQTDQWYSASTILASGGANHLQLKKVAINNALPPEAARGDGTAKSKYFGPHHITDRLQ